MEEPDSSGMSMNGINQSLERCEGWSIDDMGRSIRKDFQFESFKEAMDFANKIAEISGESAHYPNLRIWEEKNLEVKFTTGRAGLTEKDFELAEKVDGLGQ